MILSCLLRGERSVGEIANMTGIGQPALSQQLAELRRADLVRGRKEAKQVWYMLADENVMSYVSNIEAMFGGIGTVTVSTPKKRPLPTISTPGRGGFCPHPSIVLSQHIQPGLMQKPPIQWEDSPEWPPAYRKYTGSLRSREERCLSRSYWPPSLIPVYNSTRLKAGTIFRLKMRHSPCLRSKMSR